MVGINQCLEVMFEVDFNYRLTRLCCGFLLAMFFLLCPLTLILHFLTKKEAKMNVLERILAQNNSLFFRVWRHSSFSLEIFLSESFA